MTNLRFAVYLTGAASPYTMDRYGDYGVLFNTFMEIDGEDWQVFDSQKEEYPDDLSQFDCILVTGSAADAHARDPWIIRLEEEIRKAHEQGLYLLGFCFGHQTIANALGGQSGRNPAGWEIGIHQMNFTPEFFEQPWAEGIDGIEIIEIHQDHVMVAPPGSIVWASTPDTPVQIYTLGDKVLCMQGHPEFTDDVVDDLVETRRVKGIIPQEKAAKALKSTKERNADLAKLRLMVNRFIRRSI